MIVPFTKGHCMRTASSCIKLAVLFSENPRDHLTTIQLVGIL